MIWTEPIHTIHQSHVDDCKQQNRLFTIRWERERMYIPIPIQFVIPFNAPKNIIIMVSLAAHSQT